MGSRGEALRESSGGGALEAGLWPYEAGLLAEHVDLYLNSHDHALELIVRADG